MIKETTISIRYSTSRLRLQLLPAISGSSCNLFKVVARCSKSLSISGTVTDLISALDVGFYASTWDSAPSAMTINCTNLWIDGTPIGGYGPLLDVIASELKGDRWATGSSTVNKFLLGILLDDIKKGGIKRDDGFLNLVQFIDPQTITFNGIISNGALKGEEILILDENPVYKEINSAAINSLLLKRFEYNGQVPSYQGLVEILTGDPNEPTVEALNTASILYEKLYETFRLKGIMTKTIKDVPIAGTVTATINMETVFKALIKDKTDLMNKLRTMKVKIDIATCPYHSDKAAGYGTKASPISLANIKGTYHPIVLWGLDAYGPDKSAPTPAAD